MADLLDYTTIDQPYNSYLERPDMALQNQQYTQYNGNVETQPVKSDGSSGDVWINNFIRSESWQPKKVGFYIDGQRGYAEFVNVFVSGEIDALTGHIGGFTIGATDLSATSGGNTTKLSSGSVAFSSGPTNAPTVQITQAGALIALSGVIGGTTITSNALIGGLIETSASGQRVEISGSSNRINIYNSAGTFIATFGGTGAGTVIGISFPFVNNGSSPVYITSADNSNVVGVVNTNSSSSFSTVVFQSNNPNQAVLEIENTGGGKSISFQGDMQVNGDYKIYVRYSNTYLHAVDSGGGIGSLKWNTSSTDEYVVTATTITHALTAATAAVDIRINGTLYSVLYQP